MIDPVGTSSGARSRAALAIGFALVLGSFLLGPTASATTNGGVRLWTQRIPKAGYPHATAASPDGTKVFVTGESGTTVAYDAVTGTKLWSIVEPSATFSGIAVSPDSSTVYVVGYGAHSLIIAYAAATGLEEWAVADDNGGADVVVSPDGATLFVAGSAHDEFDIQALAADTGTSLWVSLYDGGYGGNFATDVALSPDGSTIFIVGQTAGTGGYYNDYETLAYEASTGSQLWATRYNSGGIRGDIPTAIGVSPEGATVFVTGCSAAIDYCYGNSDFVTIAYDALTGSQRWLAQFGGPAHGDDSASALSVSPDGTLVYVVGAAEGKLSYDYAVIAYDTSTGLPAWQSVYRGAGNENDYPCCVALSPDGTRLYVTGDTGVDWATVSFDALTGKQQWSATYDGPAHGTDLAFALAVSPDGTQVYVTGSSLKVGYDFTTIDYSA